MKLFYYDKFLESYTLLPKHIQKKVQEFIQKFRKDSTLHSIHLEPIQSFKDKQLRTARIDQKYRAIIHSPKEGDIFHLMWVDNHDEAMEWAENKIVEWNRNTQTYQVYEYVDQKEDVTVQTVKESCFLDKYSDDELFTIGVPKPLLPSVRRINTLEDLELFEKYLPREVFENLFYLLDGVTLKDITNDIEEGKITSGDLLELSNSSNNKRSFFEVVDDKDVEELLNGKIDKWKIFLHPTQRTIVEKSYPGSFKLTGAAGTGKTVAALHRLKHLTDRCVKPYTILFTTYTKSLIANLKDQIKSLGINEDKIIVDNIHLFAINHAKSLGLINESTKIFDFLSEEVVNDIWNIVIEKGLSKYDLDFLSEEYKSVILLNNIKSLDEYLSITRYGREKGLGRRERIEVWNLFDLYNKIKEYRNAKHLDEISNILCNYYSQRTEKPFSHIIADEIQDFSNVELRLLRSLAPEGGDDLFLVGDPLQKIYNRCISFSQSGINIKGKRSRRLKVNYRTTEEIKNSAMNIIKNTDYDDFDGEQEKRNGYVSILHGVKPNYELFANSLECKERLEKIIIAFNNEIEKGFLNLSDICIAFRTKNELNEVKKFLHVNKFSYYDLVAKVGESGGIRLSTFHNIKGLEFKIVILFGVNSKIVPLQFRETNYKSEQEKMIHDKSERALIYVAMTRAIKELYILGYGQKSPFFDKTINLD